MALLDDLSTSHLSSALIGLGSVVVAMSVLREDNGLRSLMKSLMKGGLQVYDRAKELVAEAGEQLSDLVAEARSEMKSTPPTSRDGIGRASVSRRLKGRQRSKAAPPAADKTGEV